MTARGWMAVSIVLAIIIVLMLATLVLVPTPSAQNPAPMATSTPTATGSRSAAPLSASVSVSSPLSGASVGHTFTVSGIAPNNWYFEAVFPIMVRDKNDNVIAHAQGRAQTDWTAAGPVSFTATVSLNAPYHGPATLVLLRDNPSGLPQNDDSVEVPIMIQ